MRQNAPQFEGDPVESLLNEAGQVPVGRVVRTGMVAGLIPVGALMALLVLAPQWLGPAAPVLALPFVWMAAWRASASFIDSAHDVEFRRKYAALLNK